MVLPVIILAIIAIKLVDPGPALYIQNRQGKDGRPFRFFKLLSMRLHSDVWLRDFLAQNPEARDPRIYRDARDPRILPVVGRFLRRYSIDELPQIWNVVPYRTTIASCSIRSFLPFVRPCARASQACGRSTDAVMPIPRPSKSTI
jgi:hypothetical protein